jgi:GH24 family phage-related lysozyme (muramidase)
MRVIKMLVPDKQYSKIAAQLRSMKRIWEGKGLDGLLERRDAEASLVASCS